MISTEDPSKLDNLRFALDRKVVELEEATVIHKSLREDYLRSFKRWFLGENYLELEAEILNDTVLIFCIYENGQFSVSANEPLVVHLPKSGYHLMVDLVQFHLTFSEEMEGYHCSSLGYYFFKPVDPVSRMNRREIARVRVENYYNSSMHFCRSLYHNQLAKNGYTFQNGCPPEEEISWSRDYRYGIRSEYIMDDFGTKRMLLTHSSCNSYLITYYYNNRNRPVDLTFLETERAQIKSTGLRFLSDSIQILPSGRIPGNSILFSNSIGKKGVAHMVPEDYIPSMQ